MMQSNLSGCKMSSWSIMGLDWFSDGSLWMDGKSVRWWASDSILIQKIIQEQQFLSGSSLPVRSLSTTHPLAHPDFLSWASRKCVCQRTAGIFYLTESESWACFTSSANGVRSWIELSTQAAGLSQQMRRRGYDFSYPYLTTSEFSCMAQSNQSFPQEHT